MTDLWHTRTAPLMGTTITLVGGAADAMPSDVAARLDEVMQELAGLSDLWTRFDAMSGLEQLNDAPSADVTVDPRLGSAVAAALACRARSRGLVDPALAAGVRGAGYDRTISRLRRVEPSEVAACAARTRARPARPAAELAAVTVSADRRRVRRLPGVRLDLGGTAKGLAADIAASRLLDMDRYAVDVGGDVRVGGTRRDIPQEVVVTHPVHGAEIARLTVDRGAVATSAITRRAWSDAEGRIAHHLLDPSDGTPAWTGLLQVSARARTALEAEMLAKVALLSGPRNGAAALRARHGGLLVHADGTIEEVVA